MSTTDDDVKKNKPVVIDPSQPPTTDRVFCPNDKVDALQLSSDQGVIMNDTDNSYIVMIIRSDNYIQELWGQPPHTSVGCTSGYELWIKSIDNGDAMKTYNSDGNYYFYANWTSSVEAGRTFRFSTMSY